MSKYKKDAKKRSDELKKNKKDIIDFNTGLSVAQLQAAQLLKEGYSKARTAKAVGVHCNTITNWLKKPHFVKYYDEYEVQVMPSVDTVTELSPEDVDMHLARLLTPSINALGHVLMDKKGSDQARVNAGKFVLNTIYGRLLDKGNFNPGELDELRKTLQIVNKKS